MVNVYCLFVVFFEFVKEFNNRSFCFGFGMVFFIEVVLLFIVFFRLIENYLVRKVVILIIIDLGMISEII